VVGEREFQASHVKTETQVVANLFIEILPKLLVRSQIFSLQPGTAYKVTNQLITATSIVLINLTTATVMFLCSNSN
jgi:hypothetical protein